MILLLTYHAKIDLWLWWYLSIFCNNIDVRDVKLTAWQFSDLFIELFQKESKKERKKW